MRKVSLYLEENQITNLEKFAASAASDFSKQVRRAIDEYLARNEIKSSDVIDPRD